ncbi:serine threonine-phosphatase 6 regulatory ankyrin repeat subunit A-isoform A [Micractinium conductrix]|uniref:Serine threonine-phosphatase 6 regulatory ankyrin repeat subunit A-isoform A n=1 Tax=Micractinium conductrix TaxID=554055 RepID=A0A2P6VP23_9CHLO|nr:serine threonine-phosphatase 6 regulatory ankyrin repeat subunit A-isoform A [Micractinium conductrix]|eukprot:PSC75853.1 serine threonine-phosphatase 6 regulatory ankyrin repeat subunit A-isoform A [Micractinium conductrix]
MATRTPRLACIEGGWDVNEPIVTGPLRTPLHIAAEDGHLGCLLRLLKAGADPRQLTTEGLDALELAVNKGHTQLTPKAMAEMGLQGLQAEAFARTEQPLLNMAVMAGQLGSVKALLELGCSINAGIPGQQMRAIHAAAVSGEVAALRLLAERGAHMGLEDSEGFTVLHYCCMLRARMGGDPGDACDAEDCRHSQCIRALLSQGICEGLVEAPDGQGRTPLELACINGHAAPARVLLEYGAAAGGRRPALATPLTGACASGCPKLAALLLDRGARYPPLPMSGAQPTPLQDALFEPMQSENHPRRSRGHLQWAAVLMERGGASGAEPLVQRVGGMVLETSTLELLVSGASEAAGITAADSNAWVGDCVALLLRHGAPANRAPGAPPPIYLAARNGFPSAVEALVAAGAALLPPGRGDNALMHAADQPAAATAVLRASKDLPKAERRRLYTATVPPMMPHAGTPAWRAVQRCSGGDRQCMRLLRQCLQEAGVDGEVALPSKPAKEAPSMQQFPSLAAALGSAPGSAGSAHAAAPGHGERGQFTASRQLDQTFAQKHRDNPEGLYGTMFDRNWQKLPAAKLTAEVQRVLAPLRGAGSGADEEETRCVLIFLTNASMNSTLRRVAVQQGLPSMLASLLTPAAARRRPAAWHEAGVNTLNALVMAEPRTVVPHAPPLARYLWSLIARHAALPPDQLSGAEGEHWSSAMQGSLQALAQMGADTPRVQLLALCEGGDDHARLLYLEACAAGMKGEPDPSCVLHTIRGLSALRIIGVHDMDDPPDSDFLRRSSEGRALFTRRCLLGTAVQCMRALASSGRQDVLALMAQELQPLVQCCTEEARRYGLVLQVVEGVGSARYTPKVHHRFGCMLYCLVHYADTRTVECLFQAGLMPALEAQLTALLAGGTSPAALAAAVAAQAPEGQPIVSDTLMMCVGVALARTDVWLHEAASLKLAQAATQLIEAIPAAFGEQPQQSPWSALLRQASFMLIAMCNRGGEVVRRLVTEAGLHLVIASAMPRVHKNVKVNLLGLFMALAKHAGPEMVAEMRRQGVDPSNPFPAAPQQPLQRLLVRLQQMATDPQTQHIARPSLLILLDLLRDRPLDWSKLHLRATGPHRVFGQRSSGDDPADAPTACCACCGVTAGTPGVSIKKCNGCRQAAFCGKACQLRMWRWYGHKAVCGAAS